MHTTEPAHPAASRRQIAAAPRARLQASALSLLDETGPCSLTLAALCRRAHVSRATFHLHFANVQECLAGALQEVAGEASVSLLGAYRAQSPWPEAMRAAIAALLECLEHEPLGARALVLQAPPAGAQLRSLIDALADAVHEGRSESEQSRELPRVIAEALAGGAIFLIQQRLQEQGQGEGSLLELANPILAVLLLPYLGAAGAQAELERPLAAPPPGGRSPAVHPWEGLRMRLTERTLLTLRALEARPGASNRELAELSGVSDPAQISRLLARLERLGLASRRPGGAGRGRRNAWGLTPCGQRLLEQTRGWEGAEGEGPTRSPAAAARPRAQALGRGARAAGRG